MKTDIRSEFSLQILKTAPVMHLEIIRWFLVLPLASIVMHHFPGKISTHTNILEI